mmetsp:Transcript_3953/g.5261  ORF Transcript_3953/g.5261 Transcript_3953/m.5261 type:complete len:167 (-) Transcript_3953:134-634(-)|eukprot:CAMPEP_0196579996 /NCGR_PEP_ID=MMETSP1081-20130531/26189_1 /TAXON_ID=36882 /ORGANISM="Pyramimonas amylifera, Strain CCMP720" /LENGTH=166 /DNA_ID=CAMNT_0041899743 /DNA_START=114 /DNA_END=614 /DNA_ORIENTATION=+
MAFRAAISSRCIAGHQINKSALATRHSQTFLGASIRGRVSNGVKVSAWFKFGKNGANAEDAGIIGAQGRDEFDKDDVEQYFNYMGLLAVEGSYDTMYDMLKAEIHPSEILLLWACAEGDLPKVEELLMAGADPKVKDTKGKDSFELAGKNAEVKKEEVLALLNANY